MIEILPESEGNIVGARARGMLTEQDYTEVLIPQLEQVMEEKGHVRFLFDLGQDFKGWTLQALWSDAKFGWDRRKQFKKVAFVGGATWMDFGAKAGALLMSGELRTFPHEHLHEAWNWIKSEEHVDEIKKESIATITHAEKKKKPAASVQIKTGI